MMEVVVKPVDADYSCFDFIARRWCANIMGAVIYIDIISLETNNRDVMPRSDCQNNGVFMTYYLITDLLPVI